jgi:4-amino-4-deoxy-L-arabinose transferase-like glycosyltransferase
MLAAIYPAFVWFFYGSAYISIEPLFVFLFCCFIYSILRAYVKCSSLWGVAAGIFLGLTALTRPIILLFPAAIFIWLIIIKLPIKQLCKIFFAFLLALMFTLSFWTIRNYKIFHKIVPVGTQTGVNFYSAHCPDSRGLLECWPAAHKEDIVLKKSGLDEIERSDYFVKKAARFLIDNPQKIWYLLFRHILHFWDISYEDQNSNYPQYNIAYAFILPFCLIGIFAALKYGRQNAGILLLFVIFYFSLMHGIIISAYRYRVAIEPFIIIFAGTGMAYLFKKFRVKSYFLILIIAYLCLHLAISMNYSTVFSSISGLLKHLNLH